MEKIRQPWKTLAKASTAWKIFHGFPWKSTEYFDSKQIVRGKAWKVRTQTKVSMEKHGIKTS